MNKKFNFIINLLIILLIIALVIVMMNYYTNTSIVPTYIEENSSEEIIKNEKDKIIMVDYKESGNIESSSEVNIVSGDIETSDTTDYSSDIKLPDENNTSKNNLESLVIITSENETSSKEKREILSELDKTLMELLEVVDSVQIVDETRLITDDSEVQK